MASPKLSTSMKNAIFLNRHRSVELERTKSTIDKEANNRLLSISAEKESYLVNEQEFVAALKGLSLDSSSPKTKRFSRDGRARSSTLESTKLPALCPRGSLTSSYPLSARSNSGSFHQRISEKEAETRPQRGSRVRKISLPCRPSQLETNGYRQETQRTSQDDTDALLGRSYSALNYRQQQEDRLLRGYRRSYSLRQVDNEKEKKKVRRRSSSLSDLETLMDQLKDCRYLRVGNNEDSIGSITKDELTP